ncbi:MAG: prepilin-type N-terminal cleavage/methylation domain-containing protein [bacterium]
MINKVRKNNKSGFTIIETLVAISVLLIALAGPLTIASKGLYSSYYSRDEVTAFYLAQEGIEYFRNLRDANSLAGQSWDNHFSECSGKCRIDVTNNNPANSGITSCASDTNTLPGFSCNRLNLDTNNIYDYSTGTSTNFTREITVKTIPNGTNPVVEYQITSTVSWVSPLPNHSITLSEDLTKWQN